MVIHKSNEEDKDAVRKFQYIKSWTMKNNTQGGNYRERLPTKLGASGKKELPKILSYILRDNYGLSRKKLGR